MKKLCRAQQMPDSSHKKSEKIALVDMSRCMQLSVMNI